MEKKLISRDECKDIQMNILDVIVRICEQHGLQYYLAYGTLLGAVRHKGYIPWDDDIDIYMSRQDYSALISYLKAGAYPEAQWLKLLDLDADGYYYPFAKATDCRTEAKMDTNLTKHGIWVDIFPIDNVPDNKMHSDLFCLYCHVLRAVIIAMTTDFRSTKLGKRRTRKKILKLFACIVGKKRMALFYDHECQKYNRKYTDHAACLSGAYGKKERMPKSVLFTPAMFSFEDRRYNGTAKYDSYLEALYGDYMKLPPKEKQKTHSITASYKTNEKNEENY